MRQGKNASQAAQAAHTSLATLRRHAASAVKKRQDRYHVTDVDAMKRPMRVLTEAGRVVADIRDSRAASLQGKYWNAVDHYLNTGDRGRLRPFEGKHFRIGGKRQLFVTDPVMLERLANAGQVRFEDVYETIS